MDMNMNGLDEQQKIGKIRTLYYQFLLGPLSYVLIGEFYIRSGMLTKAAQPGHIPTHTFFLNYLLVFAVILAFLILTIRLVLETGQAPALFKIIMKPVFGGLKDNADGYQFTYHFISYMLTWANSIGVLGIPIFALTLNRTEFYIMVGTGLVLALTFLPTVEMLGKITAFGKKITE